MDWSSQPFSYRMGMTHPHTNKNMSSTPPEAPWPVIRAARTVLVVDVVEYVRLMEQDEEDTARRWQAFVGEVLASLLPDHGGRLVKSTGDGMVVEFETVPPAVLCATAMHHTIAQANAGRPPHTAMWLRTAASVGDVYANDHDIQGRAVNLAARLTSLAAPGEIVVSADVRDRLVPGVDAEPEDLGECYLKHMATPVRAFRLSRGSAVPAAVSNSGADPLRAGVAVLPFVPRTPDLAHAALGDLLADEVIGGLSRTEQLHVISRLSTVALAGRALGVDQIGRCLRAAYVVSGSFTIVGDAVRVRVELAQASDQAVVWSDGLTATIDDVLRGADAIVPRVVAEIGEAIIRRELTRSSSVPLPNLQSHSLLMSGIGLIHRSSRNDFERAHDILEHLAQRHARLPQAHAWLGKWHAMRVVQGLSGDPVQEAGRALDKAHRALDADPRSALALTMMGLVHGFMLKDLQAADRHYEAALAANPNEALAWLYTGTLRAWQGRGEEAFAAAQKALALSPIDPMKYYFDSLAAFAALSAGRLETAASLGRSALRANRLHTATHRTLAIAQWMQGDPEAARATVAQMMQVEPEFTATRYLDRFPGGQTETSREYARILREAGAAP